jgi:DNA-binding MarR family transcriptional regulator
MGADETTRQISEYSRILSQLLCDVIEHNYLTEHANGVLTKTQFTILKILSISGTYTVSEIADILHISRAAASKNIDKLVRTKKVKRKITREDRRTMEISLTESGRLFVADYERVRLQKQDTALSKFSNKEKEKFLELIREYVKNSVSQEKNVDLICLQCNGVIEEGCSLASKEDICRFYYKINKKHITIEEED